MRELEREFAQGLVVIGVHSPKFTAEGISRNLRAAVQRLELHHPVINDHAHQVWEEYAVRAWPTLMFVDPRGRVFARHEGEFALEPLRVALADIIAGYDAEGILERRPLALDPLPPGGDTLRFPGKVLADAGSERVYVADTYNDKLKRLDPVSRHITAWVGGETGHEDGELGTARFWEPSGLSLARSRLYVADTNNHAVPLAVPHPPDPVR